MARIKHTFGGLFELTATVKDFVSYLHYDNRIPPITELVIRSLDGKVHTDVSLVIILESAGATFAEPLEIPFAEIAPGGYEQEVQLKLLPALFAALKGNQNAEFRFQLSANKQDLGQFGAESELYPLNAWRRGLGGAEDGILLTAFSQPGDPIIPTILSRARELKGKTPRPGGGFFEPNTKGYQGGPDEVVAEVASIYRAIQEAELEYSNPLPNFNLSGQPIRTPSEIYKDKSATCLDTTMLMASCLESIEISPLLMLVEGHAFIGFWTQRAELAEAATDLFSIAGLVQSRRIELVETTVLCKSSKPMTFEEASTENFKYFDEEINEYGLSPEKIRETRLAISVLKARTSRHIHPLPSIEFKATGEVIVHQTELPKIEFNFTGGTATPQVSLRQDNSPARVKIWKTSLLDMTFNNPLLNRSRRSGSTCRLIVPNDKLGAVEDLLQQPNSKLGIFPIQGNIEVPKAGRLNPELNDFVTEALVVNKGLCVDVGTQKFAPLLKKLVASSRTSMQETGVNNLYMTFGSLTWDKVPESPSAGTVTSPLFLLPITLRHLGKDNFEISLDDTGEPAPNETLALKLAEFGIDVPMLSNPDADHAGIDIPALIKHVREQVNVVHKHTSWIVDEDASIGTFDFSNFHMWKDLHDNWEKLSKVPLVNHLIETDGTKPFLDSKASGEEITPADLDAEVAKLPIASDETQARAILKSLTGESFIIQGPPGTGKSQTITNLLARNLQEGKRVLFMSEKPAALAVVKSRLDEIGLGDFILDLHDKGTKPASIRNQLIAAMDSRPDVDQTGLDAAKWQYETALNTLGKYPERLHKIDEKFGASVYSARERSLEVDGDVWVTLTRAFLSEMGKDRFDAFLTELKELPDAGQTAKTYSTNPWSLSNLKSQEITLDKKTDISQKVKDIKPLISGILKDENLKKLFLKARDVEDLKAFASFAGIEIPDPNTLRLVRTNESSFARTQFKSALLKQAKEIGKNPYFSPKLAELDVADVLSKLNIAQETKLFKGRKLESVAQVLSGYLATPCNKDDVAQVFAVIRKLIDHSNALLPLAEKVVGLGDAIEFDAFDQSTSIPCIKAVDDLDTLVSLTDSTTNPMSTEVLDAINNGVGAALPALASLGLALEEFFAALCVDEVSMLAWQGEATLGEKLADAMDAWLESVADSDPRDLTRWGLVLQILEPLNALDQTDAVSQILHGRVSYQDAPKAIERSYLSLLFAKLLDDNDISNFEGTSQDSKISLLDEAAESLKKYNRGLIAHEVVSARGFDATSTVGLTGALRAELTKQRNQLPVRRLLRQYWQTVTQVAPIVAASPDSVARFLDIDVATFDLVVFDEASQIRVATAIGALGRAPQAIIVGDSNQMPPTAFFGKADGAGELDFIEEDLFSLNDQESILSMAEVSQIPAVMLTWHYRSQDELLIAFSNKYIYEGKLSSFPSPRVGEIAPGDRKLRLDENLDDLYVSSAKKATTTEDELEGRANTNLGEAKRVVKTIQEMVRKAGAKSPSIGVITMNENQRELIEKLLEATGDDKIARLRNDEISPQDYLFVRALERVQGDERDSILLSIGFAKTSKEGRLSMTFGPLVKGNSHRRLNVAVTRARKEMIVFSSFKPEDMDLKETSSKGLKLLKKFLELAGHTEDVTVATGSTVSSMRDRHREDIAKELEAQGLKVVQNLGLSNFRVDLAICDPRDQNKCILAIMLDGRSWKSRLSSSDRELLPGNVLKGNMHWPAVERIWLPMWLRDRNGEVLRIQAAVEAAIAQAELAASQPDSEPEPELGDNPDAPITGILSISELLKLAEGNSEKETPIAKQSKSVGLGVNVDEISHFVTLRDQVMVPDKTYIKYLDHPKIKELLLNLVGQLTATEGPVSPTRAVQFIAKCFGLTGVKSARADEILAALPTSAHKRDKEGFIFPKGMDPKDYKVWAKQNPGIGRGLQDISLTEISNAMQTLCSKTAGMESAELAKQASLAFGASKLTKIGDKRMFDAEKLGIMRGILVEHDGIILSNTEG